MAKLGDALGHQHLFEHSNGIGHAAFQGIIGVHQQGCIVGINLAICLNASIFAVEHLHPCMRHGAAGRNAVHLIGQGAGSAGTAADISRSCADDGCVRALGMRREPNSNTARPWAARTIRHALVAIMV